MLLRRTPAIRILLLLLLSVGGRSASGATGDFPRTRPTVPTHDEIVAARRAAVEALRQPWTPAAAVPALATESATAPDGNGGAIFAWVLPHTGGGRIFAQRVDVTGAPVWGDGVELLDFSGDPSDLAIVTDSQGGAVVVWRDRRADPGGSNYDIYAQRVTNLGGRFWAAGGLPVCTEPSTQYAPALAPEPGGGAIFFWPDARSGNLRIHAQRVSGAGIVRWAPDGIEICPFSVDQADPTAISDGAGGALFAWVEAGRGPDFYPDVFIQRVNNAGTLLWGAGAGVSACVAVDSQTEPSIAPDGAGGAIVTWTDLRYGGADIYAQRFDASGTRLWTWNGVPVCTSGDAQFNSTAVTDGAGGAIVTWDDQRPGTDLYAQRLSAAGTPQWTTDGIALCTASDLQYDPVAISDGAGGAILAWRDVRSGSIEIYAQSVDSAGIARWTANGVPVSTGAWYRESLGITRGAMGEARISWFDYRCSELVGEGDLYVQHLDAAGQRKWSVDGIGVFLFPVGQRAPTIVGDGTGGAILAWQEKRGANYDIRARALPPSGAVLWGPISVIDAPGRQTAPVMVTDGSGGAILAWLDRRDNLHDRIYAQRLGPGGALLWPALGRAVYTGNADAVDLALAPDGLGGALIVWSDSRHAPGSGQPRVYAQRLDMNGIGLWTPDGVPLAGTAGYQFGGAVVADAVGGAIIAWYGGDSLLVRAQKLDANGLAQWGPRGRALAPKLGGQYVPRIVHDGTDGAIVTWVDYRAGPDSADIYIQRISGSGSRQWGNDGLAVCRVTGVQDAPDMIPDGSGGAIVTWEDSRPGPSDEDIYAQRINGAGGVLWQANGTLICGAPEIQLAPDIVPDGFGGALLTWFDARLSESTMYAQRINGPGNVQWPADGMPVCVLDCEPDLPDGIERSIPDGAGGLLHLWQDSRGYPTDLVVIQHLASNGAIAPGWNVGVATIVAADAEPGRVRLEWRIELASGERVALERTSDGSGWTEIAGLTPDAAGHLRYEDHDIIPGARYGYRLGFGPKEARQFDGEVWLEVPARLVLRLEGARPNPARGELGVSFTLPRRAVGRLELLDVSGRRVASHSLAGLDPGDHVLKFGGRGALTPGVYLIRLTQDGLSVERKAVVVR